MRSRWCFNVKSDFHVLYYVILNCCFRLSICLWSDVNNRVKVFNSLVSSHEHSLACWVYCKDLYPPLNAFWSTKLESEGYRSVESNYIDLNFDLSTLIWCGINQIQVLYLYTTQMKEERMYLHKILTLEHTFHK